jgi:hypothetical protein
MSCRLRNNGKTPLFLHILARAIKIFLPAIYRLLNSCRKSIKAQSLHPQAHLSFQIIMISEVFSLAMQLE